MITCKELMVGGAPYSFCEADYNCGWCGGRSAGCEYFESPEQKEKKPFEKIAEARWYEKALRCPVRYRDEIFRGNDLFYCRLLPEVNRWGVVQFNLCTMGNCAPCYWSGD